MVVKTSSGREFRAECEMIDVTSAARPDLDWILMDMKGHEHRWYVHTETGVVVARNYDPAARYELPTLTWIVEVEATDEYPEIGHYECRECSAIVRPGRCADNFRRFIAGLKHYYIDDVSVSYEEFKREAEREGLIIP